MVTVKNKFLIIAMHAAVRSDIAKEQRRLLENFLELKVLLLVVFYYFRHLPQFLTVRYAYNYKQVSENSRNY